MIDGRSCAARGSGNFHPKTVRPHIIARGGEHSSTRPLLPGAGAYRLLTQTTFPALGLAALSGCTVYGAEVVAARVQAGERLCAAFVRAVRANPRLAAACGERSQ